MRTPNLGTPFYSPGIPPSDPKEIQRFLQDELIKLSAVIQALALGQLDKTYAAPNKPREGMVRMADGTQWNPGSGAGVYAYYGAAWHFLG